MHGVVKAASVYAKSLPLVSKTKRRKVPRKEQEMQKEGVCFLIFVHVHEIRVPSQERPKESKRASVSFSCQGACMVREGWWSCRAARAEHARGRRYAGVCPLKVRVHPHRAL